MREALEAAREALRGEPAWLVGGAVRDGLLGRDTDDIDLAVAGDPKPLARRLSKAIRGTAFELSGEFGAWRVVAPGHAWHVDLVALTGGDIHADLAQRDFTINAMAEPLAGGELVDPHGGERDLRERIVRMVSPRSLADDPLRALRAIRFAVELDLALDPETAQQVTTTAPRLESVAPERIFAELKRVISADRVLVGLELLDEHGLTDVVLPELNALKGVDQSHFHHLDVHDHTLAVLDEVTKLDHPILLQPLSDELTRGEAMRWAALLHDAAKPQTRGELPGGRVTFIGHDTAGAQLAKDVLGRLRTSGKLREYVAALIAHHLDAGFLVHERPLDRRTIWRYLRKTKPYSADATLFTIADRLATRGKNAEAAIEAHLDVARTLIAAAAEPVPPPLVRGDELIAAGIAPGPRLGTILAQLEEDRFAGAISTREQALARARALSQ
jgi:putative nucleotidyltransferase with HDIG domain